MVHLNLVEPGAQSRLAAFIAAAAGLPAQIAAARPLRGGAIQENWLVTAEIGGKTEELVLRTDAPTSLDVSHGRAQEFALLRAAHRAGVAVPEPLWLCRDHAVLGQDFYLMRRIAGVAQGHRVVKDKSLGGDRSKLAQRLGAELALIHSIKPGAPGLEFLPVPEESPALAAIAGYRSHLDRWERGYPVLEWGLRRLELTAPASDEIVLTHQDFRTGNYMIDAAGLTGILDWEFAAWGEPMTDIAWFCARCWRFGADSLEAGGIAPRSDFYRGYEQASGRRIDSAAVHFWEAMAHIRWAVIALQQAHRHVSGGEASLELALTGRLLPELELMLIDLLAPGPWPPPAPLPAAVAGEPTGGALLTEARRVLLEELLPLLPAEKHYEARMTANAMAIAGRERAALQPPLPDLKPLARAIRAGHHDNDESLRDLLAADVLARLAISNPRALPPT
ncbi:MAG TPA: phosphotransferase [Dongiaceae bacterium]|nr:phosphotransferase [Dongiaceae bacterium]